jgi:hypothetical protein
MFPAVLSCAGPLTLVVRHHMNEARMPNRWMRLRRQEGFTDEAFGVFCASADVLVAHASALLRNWAALHPRQGESIAEYVFLPPEMSEDRTMLSLPIAGTPTVGTRAAIENGLSYLLWQHMSFRVMEGLEEGITETLVADVGPVTNWRTPAQSIGFVNADPEFRRRMVPN